MRIVFHIGMGKTGTTSIQHALKESADALARQNAAFLSMSLDEINPASTGIANYYRFINGTAQEKAEGTERFHSYLVERAAKEGIETFIFSNERVYENGRKLEPFFNGLKAKGLAMSFVVYMRDPRSWLPSAYTQWAIRHKTNQGPVQGFATAARRLIGRYEEIRFWQEKFGDVLTVRPFEKGFDVVQDFAQTVGVTLPETNTRKLERGEPADLLLRAMLNTRFHDPVLPNRFHKVVTNSSRAPVPSLREMSERCFNHEAMEEIIAEKRELFDDLRDSFGFDLLAGGAPASRQPDEAEIQRRVIDYLVEMSLDQAQRLIRLEQLVSKLKAQDGNA